MLSRIKGYVYELVLYLAILIPRKKPSRKKVLIVRVDEIGDYMLWHNFLADIVLSETCRDAEIHFLGNQSWKTLFSLFDKPYVQQDSWMDKLEFKSKIGYRFRLLRAIYQQGYHTVINPTFSRDKRYDDSIVKAACARHRIGMVANQESVKSYETGYDRNLYTSLFEHAEKPVFEFLRNKMFTGFVLGRTSSVTTTRVNTQLLPDFSITLPEKYFIVFPGSRSASRIWPAAYFVQVAAFLAGRYGWTAVVCGTRSDSSYTEAFVSRYTHPVLDLTGQTSLPDMLSVFKNAQCLISVDTGSVHLATAVGCVVFGIFNGSQYGRFAPYPADMVPGFHAIYPDDTEEELKDASIVARKYEFVVPVAYENVLPGKVIAVIEQYYK